MAQLSEPAPAPPSAPTLPPPPPATSRRRLLGAATAAVVGAVPLTADPAGACLDPAPAAWPPPAGPAVHDIVDHGAISEEMRSAPAYRTLTTAQVAERNLAAIQGAMAAIASLGGGTLFVPSGRFAVRADCRADRIIVLVDRTTVLFAPGASFFVVPSERTRYFLIHGQRVSDVTIVGARLEGPASAPSVTDGFGIYLVNCERVAIRSCHVSGVLKDGLYLRDAGGAPTRGVTVTDSTFERCGRHGATVGGAQNVSIVGCTFRRNGEIMAGRSGLVLEPQYNLASENRYIRVIGCRFEDNARFGMLVGQKNPSEAVVVCGCEFTGNPGAGLSTGGVGPRFGHQGSPPGRGSGTVIVGNHAAGNGAALMGSGGAVRVGSPDAVVAANSCHGDLEYEIWVNGLTVVQHEADDEGDVLVPVTGCVVTGNRLVQGPGGRAALGFYDRDRAHEHVAAHNLEVRS